MNLNDKLKCTVLIELTSYGAVRFKDKRIDIQFVSNNPIQVKDWFITPLGEIGQCHQVFLGDIYSSLGEMAYHPKNLKKIEASTANLSNVPTIPIGFIEKFVAANGKIHEVLLDLELASENVKRRTNNTVIVSAVNNLFNKEEVKAIASQTVDSFVNLLIDNKIVDEKIKTQILSFKKQAINL